MYSWIQPVVSVLAPMLTFFFQMVQDWGLAIILLTLFVRLILFPLSLRTAKQQVKQVGVQAEIKQLRERFGSDQKRLTEETVKLYRERGIKPLAMFGTAIIQMPIFMGMYSLFRTHGVAMSSMLIPWVTSFSQTDPWHILPILSAGFTFLTSMLPLTSELSTSSIGQRLGMSLLIVPIFLIFMWKAPVALGLYWTTGSLWALMERGFYRTSFGKTLLRGKEQPVKVTPEAA